MHIKIETLVRDLPVIREGEGEGTLESEALGFGIGGNERGMDEEVHELELFGSGKSGPS